MKIESTEQLVSLIGKSVWRAYLTIGIDNIRFTRDPISQIFFSAHGWFIYLEKVDGAFKPEDVFETVDEALDDLLVKFTDKVERARDVAHVTAYQEKGGE